MKQISTQLYWQRCLQFFLIISIVAGKAQAQTYPTFNFSNGVLNSGTALSLNAVYKYANAATGVDAYVSIDSLIGGAQVTSLDTVGTGYNEALQPRITTVAGQISYAVLSITFKIAGTATRYNVPNLAVTALDIDGYSTLKEYAGLDLGGGSFSLLSDTAHINVTAVGTGFRGINVKGVEFTGIDTSGYAVMYKVQNANVAKVIVRFGAEASGSGLTTRNYSIYFKNITRPASSSSNNQRVITTLPVKFASFTATRNNKNTELKWTTATEINNSGFYVQKKTGGEWKDIAFVFSKTHNGSSTGTLSYSYTDLDVTNSAVQYRIMQVDMDGKVSYSEVRTLVSDKQTGKVVLFPNPSLNGTVTISFDNSNTKEVQVSDLQGRMIKSYPAVNSSSLSLVNLPIGFYSIRILDLQTLQVTTAKLVVQK